MILIKDRHVVAQGLMSEFPQGKYDTYKGSTQTCVVELTTRPILGKYDTYKGSTQEIRFPSL